MVAVAVVRVTTPTKVRIANVSEAVWSKKDHGRINVKPNTESQFAERESRIIAKKTTTLAK